MNKSARPDRVRTQLDTLRQEIKHRVFGGTRAERATWARQIRRVRAIHRRIWRMSAIDPATVAQAHTLYNETRNDDLPAVRTAARTIPHALGMAVFRCRRMALAAAAAGATHA